MLARKAVAKKRAIFLSKSIIFDTGAIIELFNKDSTNISDQIENHLADKPHSSRIVYEPNLVELIYLLIKKYKSLSPKDIKTNLDHFGIEIYPVPEDYSKKIHSGYFSFTYKDVFDYADFFMCASALRLGSTEILTVDRDDLPNALSAAVKIFASKGESSVKLIRFS